MTHPVDVTKRVWFDKEHGGFRSGSINVAYTCPIKDIVEALPLRMHAMNEEQIAELLTIFEAEYVNRQAAKCGYVDESVVLSQHC